MSSSTPTSAEAAVTQKSTPTTARAASVQAEGSVQARRRASAKPAPATAPKRQTSRAAPSTKAPAASEPARAPKVAKVAKAGKSAKSAKAEKAHKPEKVEKADEATKTAKRPQPLVRDSFTMPADDFALVGTLKARALAAKHVAKKSELLRAGLHALQAMSEDQLMATLRALQPIKLGRPKK